MYKNIFISKLVYIKTKIMTCTDSAKCVVDRRCTNSMDLDTCDWNTFNGRYLEPHFKVPYYEKDRYGKPVHPYLTNFIKGIHDRQIEGFGMTGGNTLLLVVLLVLAVVGYYYYANNSGL